MAEKKKKRRPLVLTLLILILILVLLLLFRGIGLFNGTSWAPNWLRTQPQTSASADPKQGDATPGLASSPSSKPSDTAPTSLEIVVKEQGYLVDGNTLSLEELSQRLAALQPGSTVQLIDDKAVKASYETLKSELDKLHIKYTEQQR